MENFEETLKDCMSKPWFIEKCCIMSQQMMMSDNETLAERNLLQNNFLNPAFQKIVVKKCVNVKEYDEEREEIDKLYETDFYKKCMHEKTFDLNTIIDVEFNPDRNWDVCLMYRFRRPFVWCSISDIDAANYHKHRIKEKLNPKFMDIVVNESEFGPYINFGFPGLERSHIHLIIKATLGDEYPSVLAEMNTYRHREMTSVEVFGFQTDIEHYDVLLVGEFNSKHTSKLQLKEIFTSSQIEVLFMNDLIGFTY